MARYTEKQRETAYRIYVTDCFYLQGQGMSPSIRFDDWINKKPQIADDRSGEEIILDVMSRNGLTFRKGE